MVEALLDRDARGRSFFDTGALQGLADQLTTPIRDVDVGRDEEHNAWLLKVDDRSTGYTRSDQIGPEFVTSGEFRTLAAGYAEIRPWSDRCARRRSKSASHGEPVAGSESAKRPARN